MKVDDDNDDDDDEDDNDDDHEYIVLKVKLSRVRKRPHIPILCVTFPNKLFLRR